MTRFQPFYGPSFFCGYLFIFRSFACCDFRRRGCGGYFRLSADLLHAPGNLRPASRIFRTWVPSSGSCPRWLRCRPRTPADTTFFFSRICFRCKLVSAPLPAFLRALNISPASPGSLPPCLPDLSADPFPALLPDLIPGRGALSCPRRVPLICGLHCGAVCAERTDAGPEFPLTP